MELLVLSSRKQGLLFLFLTSFFLSHTVLAEVRRVCPRLEGIEFAQCFGGSVAIPDIPTPPEVKPPEVVPVVCTGTCYRVTGSSYTYFKMVDGTPGYAGQTRPVCAGGITPGVACEEIVGAEGRRTGQCKEGTGTGDTCAGGWTYEIDPATVIKPGPPVCALQYGSCYDTVVEYENSRNTMFNMCSCGPNGMTERPTPAACQKAVSTCTPP